MMKILLLIFTCFLIMPFAVNTPLDSKLQKYLLSQNFEGKWKLFETINEKNVFPWTELQGNEGIAVISFTHTQKNSHQVQGVIIEFLMPKYYDEKVLKFKIVVQQFNQQFSRWEGSKSSNYQIFDGASLIKTGTIQISFVLDSSLIGIKMVQNMYITVSFQPQYLSPHTSFFFVIAAFVVFLTIKRKNKVEDTRIRHQVIPCILSCFLILLISICEIIIGFRSLFGKMSPQAFFTVAGYINLAILYQTTRFYWSLLFKQRWSIIAIWIVGCFYIWFLLFFKHNPILQILNALIFLPQIGYHCFRGQKIQPDFKFIWLILTYQLYIMYFKSCPANIFKQSPSYLLAYLMASLLIAQIGILIGQIYIGPRFFIPSFLLSAHFNYYQLKNLKATARGNIECHICLQQIKIEVKNRKNKIMVTPCNHKWMLVQMKCPVDRCNLPPL